MRRISSPVALWISSSFVLLGVVACSPNLSVPTSAEIRCTTKADCPGGFVCAATHRCVAASALSTGAPALIGEPAPEPTIGTVGTVFSLRLTANRPLLEDPRVYFTTGSRTATFTIDEANTRRAAQEYAYTYTADGSERSGSTNLLVDLQDTDGNTANGLSAGSITFDFAPPRLTSATLTPHWLTGGRRATLDVVFDEATSSTVPAVVSMRQGSSTLAWTQDTASSPTNLSFSYVATGNESPAGAYTVSVSATDVAGNTSVPADVGVVNLDFVAPSVTGVVVEPPVARTGDVVQVLVDVDEPPAGTPSLSLEQSGSSVGNFGAPQITGNTLAFLYTADAAAEGDSTLVLSGLQDLAGNVTPTAALSATLGIDDVPPALQGAISIATPRSVAGVPCVNAADQGLGASITIAFTLTDQHPNPSNVHVTVGPYDATCNSTAGSAGAYDYTCTYVLTGSETDGRQQVVITAADAVGNTLRDESKQVIFDFTPPDLASGSVAYVPGAGNPLAVVDSATTGTTIIITALPSEAIDTSVAPTMTAAGGGLSFSPTVVASNMVVFQAVLPSGFGNQSLTPTITWTDLAGNPASFTASTLVITVKTSAPVLSVDQTQISFFRSPTGSPQAESLGTNFSIPPGPYEALAPLEPRTDVATLPATVFDITGAPTAVRVWSDSEETSLMGTLYPLSDGTWPRQALANVDTPTAYVTGIDSAGNESAPVKIANTEWLATPHSPGGASSPQAIYTTQRAGPQLALDATAAPAGVGYDAADGVVSSVATIDVDDAREWVQPESYGASPSARVDPAIAYDRARGRVVLFGGYDGRNWLNDLWEWDGHQWQNVTPPSGAPSPSGRSSAGMAYDAARGRIVLYGGTDGGVTPLNDTWEWDGTSWVQRATTTQPGFAPTGGLSGMAMAYDAARGKVVLFGGCEGTTCSSMTWEWDGTSWTLVTSGTPSARFDAAMAYDPDRGTVLMYGGHYYASPNEYFYDELWEWNGTWTQVTKVATWPEGRMRAGLVYDSVRHQMVLYGGEDLVASVYTMLGDTWDLDASTLTWTPVTPLDPTAPAPRAGFGLVFDESSGFTLAINGEGDYTGTPLFADTWAWNGMQWMQRTNLTPPDLSGVVMAYDAHRKRTVVFGGAPVGTTGTFSSAVWEWDGYSWSNPVPSGSAPAARTEAAMDYDGTTQEEVVFGGRGSTGSYFYNDTWSWDGASWTQRVVDGTPPSATQPSGRSMATMVYDPVKGVSLVFGGETAINTATAELWEWNDATGAWNSGPLVTTGTPPSARYGHAAVYDSGRGVMVVFGAPVFDSNVYDFNSSTNVWTVEGSAAESPTYLAMVYDPERQRTLVYGGDGGGTGTGCATVDMTRVFEWTGSAKVGYPDPVPLATPGPRQKHAMVWDSARGRVVLFGGDSNPCPTSPLPHDLWEWDSDPTRQPAIQLDAVLDRQIPLASVTGIKARAFCGGQGASTSGASLYGWSNGAWQLLVGPNSAGIPPSFPTDGSSVLTWPAGWPATTSATLPFILPRDGLVALQCRPADTQGPGAGVATSALDYIEVAVDYQAPNL